LIGTTDAHDAARDAQAFTMIVFKNGINQFRLNGWRIAA
jgi:hypothetical protein